MGENDAANAISKNMIAIVSTFNDAVAPWTFDQFFMTPQSLRRTSLNTNGKSQQVPNSIPPPSTWASIAAKTVNGRNSLIKYRPSDGVKMTISEEEVVKEKEDSDNMRVIWIQGWAEDRPLAEITEIVSQGPIVSMVRSEEYGAACVIFYSTRSVQDLLMDEECYRRRKGESMFGAGHTVIKGLPFAETEDIRRMDPPINERRRLTFARSQLFAHGMTERRFKQDIFDIVGESNVELVWLFNTGNGKSFMLSQRTY